MPEEDHTEVCREKFEFKRLIDVVFGLVYILNFSLFK